MNWAMSLRLTTGWRMGLLLVVFLLALGVRAQPWAVQFDERLTVWQTQLDAVQAAGNAGFAQSDVVTVQNQLEQVVREVRQAEQSISQQVDAAQKQLDTLGEAPAVDAPAEDPSIAQLRSELNANLSEARAYDKRMKLVRSSAETLLADLASSQRRQVRDVVLQRNPTPLTAVIWRQAGVDGLTFIRELMRLPGDWWSDYRTNQGEDRPLIWLALLPLAGFLVTWPLRYVILRRFGRNPQDQEPSYARRITGAFFDGLANTIVPVAMISLVAGMLAWQGVLSGLFGSLVYAVIAAFSAVLLVFGMSRAALSPHLVQWRVLPVEPVYIGTLLRLLALVLILLTMSFVLLQAAWRANLLTQPLEAVFFFIQSVATALALGALLSPRFWTRSVVASQELGAARGVAAAPDGAPGSAEPSGEPKVPPKNERTGVSPWIRILQMLRWIVIATPLLALAGYGRLAFMWQARLVGSAALAGLVWLFRLALHEALQGFLSRRGGAGETSMGTRVQLFWIGLVADVLLLVPTVYALLLLNGIPWVTLRLWSRSLLTGFSVGHFSITPSSLLVAVMVLVLGLTATNLLRRWLARYLLPNTRLDQGAQDSVAVGTGYAGVALTLLLVVSALGIDMSRLTIVLGALSLGIGFGLQNLVQNFAAGILLLIERPVKVGDWIKIAGTEGTVKRISVRSTEIEVFDRSTVFVPNSDLTAHQVINRTHRDAMMRLVLPIQVTQDTDPREVERVLLDCVAAQPHVRWYPQSYVWFRGFAGGVLNFELRVYIEHPDHWVTVDNSLNHAIAVAFKAAGLVFAHPQYDVRLREPMVVDPAAAPPQPDIGHAAAPA